MCYKMGLNAPIFLHIECLSFFLILLATLIAYIMVNYRARRKPRLLTLFDGVPLLRFDMRQYLALM